MSKITLTGDNIILDKSKTLSGQQCVNYSRNERVENIEKQLFITVFKSPAHTNPSIIRTMIPIFFGKRHGVFMNFFYFQVLLSSFTGPYFFFYILTLCIYPVKTYLGEFSCYLMIYFRFVYVCKSKYLSGFSSNFNKLCLGENL